VTVGKKLHINDEYRVELREGLIQEGVFPTAQPLAVSRQLAASGAVASLLRRLPHEGKNHWVLRRQGAAGYDHIVGCVEALRVKPSASLALHT
jgi:hypothetical protein